MGNWKFHHRTKNDLRKTDLVREDGRIEKVCEHGVGHPIGHLHKWESWMGVHGCDGCCSKAQFWLDEVKDA
jgi:hypothetical protein